MQKPNMGLDFIPHIRITWYRACTIPNLAWSIDMQQKMPLPDIPRISKTTKPIKLKIRDNIETMKMYSLMQYYDVTTNWRRRTAAILKIVKTPLSSRKIIQFWWNLAYVSRLCIRRQLHDQNELNWTLLENSSHEAKERWKQDTIIK